MDKGGGHFVTVKKERLLDSTELRRRAEDRLVEKPETIAPPETQEELLRLHHELQVHQVELEMQNTELRQNRDDLETALERYADLYDFAPVGYFALDNKGTICSVNLTGAGLVGGERSRLVGQRFKLFVTDEDWPAFTVFLGKVFTSPVKVACEVALKKDGSDPLCIQVEGIAVSSQECRIALIDITERKLVEKSLRLAKNAADQLRIEKMSAEATSRLKSQFLNLMSHELRTPMGVVLNMLDVLLLSNIETEQREFTEIAKTSARSLLRILNDILDMANCDAGKLIIEEKTFSLQECITQAADIITPELRRKGLDFSISVAEEVPDTLVGDNVKVLQVLLNIIGNAVKFTEAGTVVVRVTSGRTTSDGKREFTFTVTDTGIGIPDDKKGLLFQSFSQVDASPTRKFGGTGLGLAICKEIVELMGGNISFVSEEGVGTAFSFTIPLKKPD